MSDSEGPKAPKSEAKPRGNGRRGARRGARAAGRRTEAATAANESARSNAGADAPASAAETTAETVNAAEEPTTSSAEGAEEAVVEAAESAAEETRSARTDATDGNAVSSLSAIGPETYQRNHPMPPRFLIDAAGSPFFAVEMATDPLLFLPVNAPKRRPDNFYASYEYEGLKKAGTRTVYSCPLQAWVVLRSSDRIYYRAITSSAQTAWLNFASSLDITTPSKAPFITLTGLFTHSIPDVWRPEERLWRDPPGYP